MAPSGETRKDDHPGRLLGAFCGLVALGCPPAELRKRAGEHDEGLRSGSDAASQITRRVGRGLTKMLDPGRRHRATPLCIPAHGSDPRRASAFKYEYH